MSEANGFTASEEAGFLWEWCTCEVLREDSGGREMFQIFKSSLKHQSGLTVP